MTPFTRNLLRFAVVWFAAWVVMFAYAFAVTPSFSDLFGFAWCVAFGAWSLHVLRADRKRGVEA
jgi:hypothetical protein